MDKDCLVCLSEVLTNGDIALHQFHFPGLPPILQEALHGQEKGYKIGIYKIVGIFHIWDIKVDKKLEILEN